MKTYILFFILFAGINLQAAPSSSAASVDLSRRQISREIGRRFSFPEKLKTSVDGETVRVSFIVSEEGKIRVQQVDTENSELEDYIRREMEEITLDKIVFQSGDLYLINLKFSVL